MVKFKKCPICGEIVGEFEQECEQCGYNKVWEEDKDE
jgi:RNA polymerase subunit RPABC4/transcription elongation factor Spt4